MRRLVSLFALIVAAPLLAAEPAQPPPTKAEEPRTTESFAAPPFIEDPELSPNGKWMTSRLNVGGAQLVSMQ